ncbi:DUF502 domain-containing protein [Sphingosinicella microcystinivorans]|uniref:Membrane protein n=1 Tax=Sphingosinicella microcystinivorans TaxID=335406 RepID=A0AAD1G0E8_SPHMI|nr:DUF502 domain-containing protein [Sphingosinicella microcystinivorans]RKS90685.1 putative membrane protein [Sphingosinicella microcystinivorans]BBE33599.1 hypothetical protein SmB9_12570 [Sphingosinicella microcystinivorans]
MTPPDDLPEPPRPPWRIALDRIVAQFLTGLLFLLPFILTLMILDWLVRQVAGLFGEETLLGSALTSGGAFIFGDGTVGFWLLLIFVVAGIWGVGFAFGDRARRSIDRRLDAIIGRIPVLRDVYRPVSKLVRMLGTKNESDLAAMRVIACRFGDRGADVLALLASPDVLRVGGEERMLVYLPSAPLPMTGGLVLVPPSSIIEVTGVTVDELLKCYISLGMLSPDALKGDAPALLPN